MANSTILFRDCVLKAQSEQVLTAEEQADAWNNAFGTY